MTRHRTKADDARVAGWVELDDEWEITVVPLLDPNYGIADGSGQGYLFARLTYASALKAAARYGAQLPTAEHLQQLADIGLQLYPYLGTPTAETTLLHSRLHDEDVARQLREAGWDGSVAVAGAGKHWIDGAPAGKSRLMGWDKDGPGPGKALWQPPIVAHNRSHHDDGTTTLLVRRKGTVSNEDIYEGLDEAAEATDDNIVAAPPEPPSTVVDAISELPPPPDTEPAPASLSAPGSRYVELVDDYIQAKNYRRVGERQIDLLVLHSTENPLRPGRKMARAVGGWFGGANAPVASAHFINDDVEVIQCVRVGDVAYAAPGANRNGVQLEIVGQAFKTNWLKEGLPTITKTAELVAALCQDLSIPLCRIDVDGLKAGERGITTHRAVTEASKRSTHVDPGGPGDARWPWSEFLDLVRGFM